MPWKPCNRWLTTEINTQTNEWALLIAFWLCQDIHQCFQPLQLLRQSLLSFRSKQAFSFVMSSTSLSSITDSWESFLISYAFLIIYNTNAVSVNYFLFVCAGCKVSQSCVITILNKLPNLTALNLTGLMELPANESEVSMHNVQMWCIHCTASLVCQVSQEERGASIPSARFHGAMDSHMPILRCTHPVNPLVHPKCLQWNGCRYFYAPSIHHMTLSLAVVLVMMCDDTT